MTPATPPLLEVENLTVSFETEQGIGAAVTDVSFAVERGSIHGIVGESGSGKSVTVRAILQLLDDSAIIAAEQVRYKSRELLDVPDSELWDIRGGEIGVIFQNPTAYLNPVMTVGEQIAEVARRHDSDIDESTTLVKELTRKYITGTAEQSQSWQRAVELLERVGLPDPAQRAREYPHQLSGGMKQRVMIAQVLAGDPSVIIADEPTTALDVSTESQILRELVRLRDDDDLAVVFITHDMAVISEICDRVTVMYAGEVMETGPKDRVLGEPRHPYTKRLLDSVPKLSDRSDRLDVIEGDLPSPFDQDEGCPFRDRCPEAMAYCENPLESHGVAPDHTVRCHLYRTHHHSDPASAADGPEDRPADAPGPGDDHE